MYITMIALLSLAILLLILSFFTRNKYNELESQIEQVSLSTFQEVYKLKKKMKVLEEEILGDEDYTTNYRDDDFKINYQSNEDNKHLQQNTAHTDLQRVLHLHKQGYKYDQIAKLTSLGTEEVRLMLQSWGDTR
ncbi:DUF6115 domain-containing protein [Bacillus salinus]|uniref:DUF6115 domain-containing protein n=1 Tax=Bacillus sp. HMF5848 TaxID=2495421 RepID=UPI001639D9E3|nr:hypothetical protein [Bacillus sp. HMF5848]